MQPAHQQSRQTATPDRRSPVSQLSTLNSRLPAPRRAFTLIELLIVIAIIGVLAGLLLGGVFGVFGIARVTQVTADINSLDKAIQDFKLRFGVEPPSFIVIHEDATAWGMGGATTRRSRAFLQRVWPDFDFTNLGDPTSATVMTDWNPNPGNRQIDINRNGTEGETIVLQSTEALVFFLGGPNMLAPLSPTSQPQPLGFSVNPQRPFVSGGQRVGPFFQFDLTRRSDVDNDGNPEYMDPIPGQILPYLYFSGYEGAGYRPFGADGMVGNGDDEIIEQSGTDLVASVYMVNDQNWGMSMVRPEAIASEYINAKSYQIISPGQDFRFGAGGTYIRGQGLAITASADQYRSRDARKAEFDNITNFSGGLIGEQTVTK